jgi:hypothetical protein
MGFYQICSNKSPGVKIGPAPGGHWFSLFAYSKNLKNLLLTHYPMSILWKMAVFNEKSPVTCSSCYKTIKTASILIKVGWTIAFVTTCSVLNFPDTMETRGHLKIAKKSLFCVDFFHQNWFQSAATSQWIEIESKAFQHWLNNYDRPGVIFSLSQVQNFLGDEGDGLRPPSNPQNRRRHIPLLATPWCIFWMGDGTEDVVNFLNNIS